MGGGEKFGTKSMVSKCLDIKSWKGLLNTTIIYEESQKE